MLHSHVVIDLVLLLGLSIVVILCLRRLNLPSIAGFLVVGVVVGPHGLGWVQRTEEVETLAELGVVLLLFSVGLEFSLPRLFLRARRLLWSGGGQVVLTIAAVFAVALAAGIGFGTAALCGILVAMSSTGFVLKSLHETRQADSPHGQLTTGILLFQDLSVVPLMLVVPLLAGGAAGAGPVLGVLGKAVAAIVGVILFARFGFSRLATLVVRLGGRELFVLFVALVALGTAWFSAALGLSVALGAFIAGLFISESEYSHEVVGVVLPFRDVFNAMFFISIGMLLDTATIAERPVLVALLVLGVLVLKGLVAYGVVYAVTRVVRTAFLSAVALAQIGEFSFLLVQQGQAAGLLDATGAQLFLAVTVASMFLSPFLIRAAPAILARFAPGGTGGETGAGGPGHEAPAVIVVGYGLNGRNISRVLKATGIAFRVIELDADVVQAARREGLPILFGDASRAETLQHAGIDAARIVVFAISDPPTTRHAVALARRLSPGIHVIVRTRYMAERRELLELGANEVIPEEFETSIEIFSRVLKHLHVPRGNIAAQAALIRREGYQLLREDLGPARELEMLQEVLAETSVDTVLVPSQSPAAGRSLKELDIRARTGASIVSVVRNGAPLPVPDPHVRLEPNDVLFVVGTHDAIDRCRALVTGMETVES